MTIFAAAFFATIIFLMIDTIHCFLCPAIVINRIVSLPELFPDAGLQ